MSETFNTYADYYDLFYSDKDYAAEARYVLGLWERHSGVGSASRPRILELGCGTGGHAEHFVAAGCSVVGVDRSPRMVARAKERLRGNTSARFEVGDAVDVDLGSRFDLVVALFHVLSYQVTNEQVASMMRTAARHLRPGGLTIFDFWHGPGVLRDLPETRVRRIQGGGRNLVRLAEPTMDAAANTVRVDYTLWVEGGEGVWSSAPESHHMRYFFLPELSLFLDHAGLSPKAFRPWMCSEGSPGLADWNAVLVAGTG